MTLSRGSRLGPYEVVALIGKGGMGEVYQVRDMRLGRSVAIKVLSTEFTSDLDRVKRFEREARMLAALNHPHIATIHGVEDAEGVVALVMELVDGETLADQIARAPVPVATALKLAGQVADALDAAHEKGIVHRDLKPSNIKITSTGVVKVLDFGLAKDGAGGVPPLDEANGASDAGRMTAVATIEETLPGRLLGTPAYMSPEQARGYIVDKRADIWAFGCVLFEMLTGRSPFLRSTITDTIAAVLEHEPDWAALPDDTPAGVLRLLAQVSREGPAPASSRSRRLGACHRADRSRAITRETAGNGSPGSRLLPVLHSAVCCSSAATHQSRLRPHRRSASTYLRPLRSPNPANSRCRPTAVIWSSRALATIGS